MRKVNTKFLLQVRIDGTVYKATKMAATALGMPLAEYVQRILEREGLVKDMRRQAEAAVR